MLFGNLPSQDQPTLIGAENQPCFEKSESLALERQLEEFLLENWARTPLAKEWEIYNTPEDSEAGNQYPTDIENIDILAKHKKEQRFLVIKLKRNQSSDETIGQVLICGLGKKTFTKDDHSVETIIIAHQIDEKAKYAVLTLPNVRLITYEIEFLLYQKSKKNS